LAESELSDNLIDYSIPRKLPGLSEIVEAQRRIAGIASRTPLVESPALSKRFGREVYLKLECFQPIRVFKIRGAYNKISQVSNDRIVAASSGNHGNAVAYVSRILRKRCTVILPENAVQEKVDMILENGAEVVKYGKTHPEREEKAREIVKNTGATYVHPFNDPLVIAGTGTIGLEIAEQLSEFDSVVVPVGGGGLISGIAIAIKAKKPTARIYGVESEVVPKLNAALKAGKIVTVPVPPSIADGLLASSLGDLTFEACTKFLSGAYAVSEQEILSAMGILVKEAHIFPEPSSAVTVAALLAGRDTDRLGKKVVLVISGGNVSLSLLSKVLSS
jgi:threonine dehydratase